MPPAVTKDLLALRNSQLKKIHLQVGFFEWPLVVEVAANMESGLPNHSY